jgi:hypothetical protein
MHCPHMEDCPLFPIFSSREFLKTWQINYCENDEHPRCQRYQTFERGEDVPSTLLSNGKHLPLVTTSRASVIVKQGSEG